MPSDPQPIAGIWYPEQSNRFVRASLVAEGANLSVLAEDGALLTSGVVSNTTVTERVGNVLRRLTLANGSVFETPDNDAIDALVAVAKGGRAGWIHRAERFHPRLVMFAVLAILFIIGIYRFALPALVELAVAVTPPVVPEIMARGTLQTLDATTFDTTALSPDERSKLREGFERLKARSGLDSGRFRLEFRQGGLIGPNAFALPDGTVVITDELVKFADGDTELLLGVLAHEIGHVELEHSLRQFYRSVGAAGLIMLIGGDIGSGMEDILVQGGGLLALSYSRAQEADADRHSVRLMAKAGYDPEAIGRFFTLLESKLHDDSGTNILATHPGTPERRKAVHEYAQELQSAN
ncbi:M48 family metallopeptidase [Phyllobacterium zundukense]|uniref:Metalloprotease n=1 Tax=Phyllobacterium zundukense TaxID=1867719 RepID=A0A2N9W4C0_9HYPH|nr:M48 family metallopeptidase [Phyllobacterium zundukense]ATU91943.1 metalloprotease [Phyllobacterium zundukense]PIO46588.1 metalloprotease [Phyllobacterium zundukense]